MPPEADKRPQGRESGEAYIAAPAMVDSGKPHPPSDGFSGDQSAGDDGEADAWERTPVHVPAFGPGTRAGEEQRVVPRSTLNQSASREGKG